MKHFTNIGLPLFALLGVVPAADAALVSLEGDSLVFAYDTATLDNIGNVGVTGDRVTLSPLVSSLNINSETFEGYSPAPFESGFSFSAVIGVQAKPGFRIDGYQTSATVHSYHEDANASSSFAFSFPYALAESAQPNNVRAFSVTGGSSGPFSTLSLGANFGIHAVSYYLYDAPGPLVEVPVYGYETVQELVGYEPVLDEYGNVVDQVPVYNTYQQEVIVGYNAVETFFPLYKISGASINWSELAVDVQVSAVPLPASAGLLTSGFAMMAASARRRSQARA